MSEDKATPEDVGYVLRFNLEPNGLITNYVKHLESFEALYAQSPARYGWRHTPVSAFTAQAKAAKTAGAINGLYWGDVARSIEAYNVHALWRGGELLRAARMCLHTGTADVLAAAILSRGLIELTCSFIIQGSMIREHIATMPFERKGDTVLGNAQLEELLYKAVFGTRLVGKESAAFQTNVITLIQKVARFPGFEMVLERYERLCEVAHPNVLGNSIFWSDDVTAYTDGAELRILDRDDRSSKLYLIVLADAIWGVAWSASNLREGFLILREQVKKLFDEFPDEKRQSG